MTAGLLFRRAPGLVFVFAVPLAAALLVGCGGDDNGDEGGANGGAQPTSPAASAPLQVTLADFSFTPATLGLRAGQSATINLKNTGQAPHTFTIDGVVDSGRLAAGESKTITLTAPQSGQLTYYCTVHGAAQMSGQASISASGASPPQAPSTPGGSGGSGGSDSTY